LRPIPVRSQ